LTDRGLRYGNNVRNLLTLEMLDALLATIAAPDTDTDTATGTATDTDTDAGTDADTDTDTDTDAGTATGTDAGTDAGPVTAPAPAPDPFPISTLVQKQDLPLATPLPKNCGLPKPNSRLYWTRLDLPDRTRLRASALDLDGYRPRVFWVRIDENGERCVRRRTQTLEVDAQAGMWDLIVEVPERAAQEGQMLILITRNPR
jgi:hypothetical protein